MPLILRPCPQPIIAAEIVADKGAKGRVRQCKRKEPSSTRAALMWLQYGGIVVGLATLHPR